MKDLEIYYNNNNDLSEYRENLYLFFNMGQNKYALSINDVVEVMKLPLLDYPQRLANNVVGLLNYNDFTINILDLRFYLNMRISPYTISNQLLVVKTDESIFGLIIDKVENIVPLDSSKIEPFESHEADKIIDFICNYENEIISIINLNALENKLKQGVEQSDVDISLLFPIDDDSRYKLTQRRQALIEKTNFNLVANILAQDRFISFGLNGTNYCINLEYVKEFLKNCPITKIPCNLDYIAGIIALRGDFITIVDLKRFLGLEQETISTEKNNIIILEIPDYKIGFLVDKIFRIMSIPEELIKKNPNNQDKFILSEAVLEDELYTILNIKNILSDERFFIEDTF
ncbi:MAG: chemotaxis protein CheW [Candidatus Gastranaerophilales bacterium]|nr:chemotaxis protein CheW [Candidatus Gastranaerophilales bacterium]